MLVGYLSIYKSNYSMFEFVDGDKHLFQNKIAFYFSIKLVSHLVIGVANMIILASRNVGSILRPIRLTLFVVSLA